MLIGLEIKSKEPENSEFSRLTCLRDNPRFLAIILLLFEEL